MASGLNTITRGIPDPTGATQRAIRALDEAINQRDLRIDELEETIDGLSVGGGAVSSVTAGSSMVTCSPTTGAVVVNVIPANFTGIPQAAVTSLVADLAGKAAAVHTHAQADVTNLVSDLAAKVPTTRNVNTTAPLAGGGNLAGDLTLSISLPGYAGVYGDGSDGNLTFDGAATVLGMVPVGGVYTLTRDIFPNDMVVNGGVTVKTAGFRIFGKGALSGSGSINDNGNPGGNAVGGVAGTAGANRAAAFFASTGPGGTGGGVAPAGLNPVYAGGDNVGGGAGTGGGAGAPGNPGGGGGTRYRGGGGGGGGGSGAGGTNGAASGSLTVDAEAIGSRPNQYHTAVNGRSPTSTTPRQSGSGGGGGGPGQASSGTRGHGGGGGAGGGHLYISYRFIPFTGTISADGGNGGNGGNGVGAAAGGGGGGGGAGGGNVCVYTETAEADLACTITANGGTGGTGGSGAGTGAAGGNGGNGAPGVVSVHAT